MQEREKNEEIEINLGEIFGLLLHKIWLIIVALTTEEEERWKAFTSRKQGRRQGMPNGSDSNNNAAATVDEIDKSSLPF